MPLYKNNHCVLKKAVKLSMVAKTIGGPQNLGPEATASFGSTNIHH